MGRWWRVGIAGMGLVTVGCTATATDDTTDSGDSGATDACPEAGAVRVLATGYENGTEGVAFGDDGTLYVTARDRLVTIDPDGTETATLPIVSTIGVAWWKGAAWVGSGGDTPALVEVAPDLSTSTRHAVPEISNPNFLTPTPWGTMLVSQPSGSTIWEWDPDGESLSTWSEDVDSPNGMVFDADGTTLYVATTYRGEGLYAVAVADGEAGAVTKVASYDPGTTPDGVALGADGAVYVVLNTGRSLERVDDGTTTKLASVEFAASVAFPPTDSTQWDPCEVVITSLFSPDVFAVQAGTTAP